MASTSDPVAAVRRFNRFYTRRIGILNEGVLGSDLSLAEMRALWEIAHKEHIAATELGERLGMDAGYVSRVVRGFRERKLVTTEASEIDGRVKHLRLTAAGRQEMLKFEKQASEEVRRILADIPGGRQDRLVAAMQAIETLLDPPANEAFSFLLREPKPGDFGWIIHRHGALYAQEHGWDATFEALVAEIVAKFIRDYQPQREHCWIADYKGEVAGCVFLVERSAHVAQLRLLLVEPSKRGMGIGKALVDECIRFARAAGYRKVVLWTNDILHAARHLYEKAGFKRVKSEKHHSFGHDLVGQTFELVIAPAK